MDVNTTQEKDDQATHSKNDQQQSQPISKKPKTHAVGKAPAIHFARFGSRSVYAVWVSIHFNLMVEFFEQDENKNDKKLAKIIKQLQSVKVMKPLKIFAIYSCIHLDYVFRSHSKQAIINDYRYLMNIY